jgi:hypothetical protein
MEEMRLRHSTQSKTIINSLAHRFVFPYRTMRRSYHGVGEPLAFRDGNNQPEVPAHSSAPSHPCLVEE